MLKSYIIMKTCDNTHHPDSLESEDSGSEEDRKLMKRGEVRLFIDARQVLEDVVEGDTHASADENIGDHGEGCQILEVADQIHTD